MSRYLAARPAHEQSVRGALDAGMLPKSLTASVRRILVNAETIRRRN